MTHLSATSSTAPPKPTASFSNLPLEIKALIVSLASGQDKKYRQRWAFEDAARPKGWPLVEKHLDNAWRGRSLAALSQTCRTLYLPTRKYMFESLNGEQLADVYFLLRIFPLHAAHILEIELFNGTLDMLTRAVALLPLIPNLRRLVLHGSAAVALFGGTSLFGAVQLVGEQDPNARLRCEPFRLVVARLEHLELVDFDETLDVVFVLQAATSLQSVSLKNCIDGRAADEDTLAEHLASMRSLRTLMLAEDDVEDGDITLRPEGWSKQRWRGPLKTLHLKGFGLSSEMVAFVDTLAPTLQHLSLHFPSLEDIIPPTTVFKASFPSLISCTLFHVDLSYLEAIVTSLAGPPRTPGSDEPELPLEELRLDIAGYPHLSTDTMQSLLAATSLFPNLSLLDFTRNSYPLPIEHQQRLLASIASRDVFVPTSTFVDPFLIRDSTEHIALRSDDGTRVSAELASRHAALKRAIEFASRHVDSLHRNGDLEGMEEAFGALGEIWGLKLLEDD